MSIATKTIVKYRALSLGIVDAGVMAVAERLDVARILTVDQQHFRAVTPNRRDWQHDTLVPFDELDAV